MRAVEVPCVLNIAAVKLKSKEYDEAVYECNKVLDIEVSRVTPINIQHLLGLKFAMSSQ